MATKERIYIDEELVPIADKLVQRRIPGSESTQGVFRDTRELVAFAAAIGFSKNHPKDVSSNGREIKLSALDPIVEYAEKHHIPRTFSAFILYMIIALIMLLMFSTIFPPIIEQISLFINNFPTYVQKLSSYLPEIRNWSENHLVSSKVVELVEISPKSGGTER